MKKIYLLLSFISVFSITKGQDMLSTIDTNEEPDYTIATFKSTRLVNMHTLEVCGPHTLDLRINHRFGTLNSGAYNAWGLDGGANIRIGLDYSPDGRFMFGAGRSSDGKLVDGLLKYRLLRQRTNGGMPISMTLFAGAYYSPSKDLDGYPASARMSYCYQLIIGRKFSKNFSFQINPFFMHYNAVPTSDYKNNCYGIAGMFRMKLTARAAITAEYAYRMSDYSPVKNHSKDDIYYDSFSVGYEVETGGHVFQIFFSNSFGIAESQFLEQTDSKWNDAGIRLGFNISRVFTIGGKSKSASWSTN